MPPLYSPGAAAVDALFQMLAEREKTKQQQLMNQHTMLQDQIAQQRDAREAAAEIENQQLRKLQIEETLAGREADRQDKERAAERARLTGTLRIGDIPTDSETLAAAQRHPDLFEPAPKVLPGPASTGFPGPLAGVGAMLPQQTDAIRFAGDAKARDAAEKKQQILDYIKGLDPNDPLRKAAEYELATGKQPAAGLLAPTAAASPVELVYDVATGKVTRPEMPADLPPGAKAHWNIQPRPPAPPREPNPQPQVFQDTSGKLRAFRFLNGTAQEVPLPADVVAKGGPTAMERNRTDTARAIKNNLPKIRQEVDEANQRGFLGPIAGRMGDFLAGKVGSTEILGRRTTAEDDRLLGALRENLKVLATALSAIHTRYGGSQAAARFDAGFQSGKLSSDMIMGALDTAEDWANTYDRADSAADPIQSLIDAARKK